MAFLIAAVVFVGLLCVLDLILSLGVMKRLREHTELINNLSGRASIGVGEEVGDFTAGTVDGGTVTRAQLADGTLVGFFSPSCPACKEKLPKFVQHAAAMPGGRDRVLATVVGDARQTTDMVAALSPVARVVAESAQHGSVASAFQISAFPSVLMLAANDRGVPAVTETGVNLDRRPSRTV
ncbi:hypothetical protein AB0D49_37905 [Streptomyces sp. NPDC048290]|uniref:hypothetical protein n=1 Tax=Streptomyces sp. NPDC048290 TaxID=3155811 RepID=UPI0034351962